ncbi:MAG: cytochrome c maturation protein CcmE [Bacteroidota bacterium]|jgi:cytochrome c-type biogenesis protein CcmE
MKRSYIILIALIAVGIAAIISSYGDASTYENFSVAAENPDREYHVVGTLNREKERYYNPQKDANYFTFYLIDQKGDERKVIYYAPEPQDFDKSEQVVIVGKMKGEEFVAKQILLKCPSKYTDTELKAQ